MNKKKLSDVIQLLGIADFPITSVFATSVTCLYDCLFSLKNLASNEAFVSVVGLIVYFAVTGRAKYLFVKRFTFCKYYD